MLAERDVTRIVRSWLRRDEHESADRVLDNVFDLLDATPQRRSWWPAWRFSDMNTFAKLALAAAAVVVVAFVGINLLPGSGGAGGSGPAVSPTPSPSPSPSPAATPNPSPPPAAFAFPPSGDLVIGRHDLTLDGVSFSLEVSTSGWASNGSFAIDNGSFPTTWAGGFILWGNAADGIFTDPCAQTEGPSVGPSAEALAQAVANVPGTTATGPTDVTVDGFPAKLVVVKIPEDPGCTAENFYLWWDKELSGRYATVLGSTISVWIIDVNGTLIQIDGEIPPGAGPEAGQEMQGIIDSIQFE
jgi:hypothetical protein